MSVFLVPFLVYLFFPSVTLHSLAVGTGEAGAKKPVIIMGVAKKVDAKKKGELMEQNQDALEYSSEEEGEDLKDTMASINSKGKKVRGLIRALMMFGAL